MAHCLGVAEHIDHVEVREMESLGQERQVGAGLVPEKRRPPDPRFAGRGLSSASRRSRRGRRRGSRSGRSRSNRSSGRGTAGPGAGSAAMTRPDGRESRNRWPRRATRKGSSWRRIWSYAFSFVLCGDWACSSAVCQILHWIGAESLSQRKTPRLLQDPFFSRSLRQPTQSRVSVTRQDQPIAFPNKQRYDLVLRIGF